MPLRNRVTPLGELIADPARGLVYGNRGCLHDDTGRIRRRYAGKRWIACRLEFRGWHREPLLQPGRFTELFFLDEATAFAAGHRPCALCRREDYVRFGELWRELHPERSVRTRSTRGSTPSDSRPSGGRSAITRLAWTLSRTARSCCATVLPGSSSDRALGRWTPAGYADRMPRRSEPATVITPPSLVEILRSGWEGCLPLVHPTMRRAARVGRR